ncbi:MAG: phosphodiester glycosidase family protein [Bacteroidota bacterium]|nr:phosphodiester glycosidase family protein [Bacteroidota bacterium]
MQKNLFLFIVLSFVLAAGLFCGAEPSASQDAYLSYTANPMAQDLQLYWKDDRNQPFKSIGALRSWLGSRGQTLLFAMNAGMYRADNTPQGLLIQDGNVQVPLDTVSGSGNFYLKPNGVFYTTRKGKGFVCTTADFRFQKNIQYATQSGPMLLINGVIHSAFTKGSKNRHIRNGVGVLPNGNLLFVLSKKEVNLYDFATYFRDQGCKNALYLDGFVSRAYLPEKQWVQTDGNFGAIIGVTAPHH